MRTPYPPRNSLLSGSFGEAWGASFWKCPPLMRSYLLCKKETGARSSWWINWSYPKEKRWSSSVSGLLKYGVYGWKRKVNFKSQNVAANPRKFITDIQVFDRGLSQRSLEDTTLRASFRCWWHTCCWELERNILSVVELLAPSAHRRLWLVKEGGSKDLKRPSDWSTFLNFLVPWPREFKGMCHR